MIKIKYYGSDGKDLEFDTVGEFIGWFNDGDSNYSITDWDDDTPRA